MSLIGSALATGRSILEPTGTRSVGHGWESLTEDTPAAHLLAKPFHINQIQETKISIEPASKVPM